MTKRNNAFYITTPIYYVNDKPHIGHAYTTILCDSFARFNRLQGKHVVFLTGTDEHGEKIETTARQLERTPQEHVDAMVVRYKEVWDTLHIRYDDFIRTTEDRHKKVVYSAIRKLLKTGDIYVGKYEGWYCVPCESFWSQAHLVEGTCPDCQRPVTKIEEENLFFKLAKYQEWLIQYIEDHPDFIVPKGKKQEVVSFLKEPLEDLCISRSKKRMAWGISFPEHEEYVVYVWFDALINYISAVGYGVDDARFDGIWPATIHMIGKDILRQHAIYWPIMLKALDIPLPEHVVAHGWWTIAGSKVSKSKGNIVDPVNMSELYGADTFRYYMLAEANIGSDGAYSEDLLINRLNCDLANDLGNLVYRSLSMTEKYFDGVIPSAEAIDGDLAICTIARSLGEKLTTCMNDDLNPRAALQAVWQLVDAANKFVEETKPWTLAKDAGKRDELARFMYVLLEAIRVIGVALSSFLPETAEKILASLQHPQCDWDALVRWGLLKPGTTIEKGQPLFQKVKDEEKK